MGMIYKCNTKAKESLKLFNHIISYLFEQEYGELKGEEKAIKALNSAKKALSKIISKN